MPLRALLLSLLCLTGTASGLGRGASLPAFELPTLEGSGLSTRELGGRVVLIDFWASWCGPCRQSFPVLNELHGTFGKQDLAVVGINVDEQRQDAEQFLASVPAAFVIALDPAGRQAMDFDVQTMPSTFLFGRDGKLRWVHQGFRPSDRDRFIDAVRAALAEAPP